MRSRAAAAILVGADFPRVASMEGGIRAWNGLVAEGPPEVGMASFPATATAGELAALAWYLEAGSRAFYAGLSGLTDDKGSRELFALLERAEESHLRRLADLYRDLAPGEDGTAFPQSIIAQQPADGVMEGGVSVDMALSWARGRRPDELLEYIVGLETNSWDLYLRMYQAVAGDNPRRVFDVLAEEEKRHLEMLTSRLEEKFGGAPRHGVARTSP